MVKGMTINILSAGLVILAVVVIYAFAHPLTQPHAAEYARTDIYVMKNAIDASKTYLEAALDYSVYQAMYDIAKRGGASDAASMNTYANKLEPAVTCQKTGQRIGGEDEVIGCVPKEFSCAEDDGEVGYTNEGYEVGLLQFLLKTLKYNVAADCKFGKGTLAALKEFQKISGIQETGFAGSETVNKLKAAFSALTYDNCGDYFYGCSNRLSAYLSSTLSEEDIKNNLKAEILKNMNSYTSAGYMFLDLPVVYLPTYKGQDVALSEAGKGMKISLAGDNLRISKKDEEEVIYLESPSYMEKIYDIDMLGMFRKAKSVSGYINGKGCEQMTADETKNEDGFEIGIKVLGRAAGPPCRATIKVNVTEASQKRFPVFNGIGVSFEPVSFEFLVNLGASGTTTAGGGGQPAEAIMNAKLIGKEEWSDLVTIESQYLVPGTGTNRLRNEVYLKLKTMINDAKKDGVNLLVASSYRSYDYQLGIWKRPENIAQGFEVRKKANAIPGMSQHQWGTDIDFSPISLSFETTNEFNWLTANANKYGFYLEYPRNNPEGYEYEPWHWTYKPISDVMKVEYQNLVSKADLCAMENVVRVIYHVAELSQPSCALVKYQFA